FKMSGEEEVWEKLDAELDLLVVDVKPRVLKLQDRSERERCALWIKKLYEPSGAGTGVGGRKNRNLYAKLLLHMLKRGVLEGPFTYKPEPGILKTLPSYMSVYFDEPNSARVQSSSPDCLLDWVVGELGSSECKHEESRKMPSKEESSLTTSLTYGGAMSILGNAVEALPSLMRSLQFFFKADVSVRSSDTFFDLFMFQDHRHKNPTSLDDSDFEARLNSWNLGLENPRYLREKPMPVSLMTPKIDLGKSSSSCDEQTQLRKHEKELDVKIKIAEGKFHEENLKLQQKHASDVQKILDRKNDEIEALKSFYKNKLNEAEETIRRLEKKVQTLIRESQVIREAKEKQIVELKKMCEQSNDSLNNEWEKRV
ncbi:CE112 protein, partial [Atlantisia rogersi]|nr:CE112 protein [Atlantisia rogersi]